MRNRFDALGERQLRNAQRLTDVQIFQVDLDERGQVLWQAGYFDIAHNVRDDAAADLDARRNIGIDEVQRYFLVNGAAGVDA